jgi:hypothetical protein
MAYTLRYTLAAVCYTFSLAKPHTATVDGSERSRLSFAYPVGEMRLYGPLCEPFSAHGAPKKIAAPKDGQLPLWERVSARRKRQTKIQVRVVLASRTRLAAIFARILPSVGG